MILLPAIFYCFILMFLFSGVLRIYKKNTTQPVLPRVSIIVVARDEEEFIGDCLLSLIHQNYPQEKLEIILVDDNAKDRTLEIAEEISHKVSFLKILKNDFSQNWKSSKKAGLELATQNATGDIFLFTDADCRPQPFWAKSMAARFENTTGLVAGFSPQTRAHSKLWNGFLIVDSIFAAFFSAGGIGWKKGITCTGRNLAMRKQALLDMGGYAATKDSLSGDDDFVLQKLAKNKKWRIGYNLDPQSVVPAIGPENLFQFFHQKKRHISASKSYDKTVQFGYLVFHLSNTSCWVLFFYSCAAGINWALPLLLKIIIDSISILTFSKFVGVKIRPFDIVVWEFLFPFYNIVVGPGAFLSKVYWKNTNRFG